MLKGLIPKMDFSGEKCLVCSEIFNADDDIVVCPECGTPHHRECWKKTGACINSALHGSGFEYKPSVSEKTEPDKKENADTEDTAAADIREDGNENTGSVFTVFNGFDMPGADGNTETQNPFAEKIMLDGSDIGYYAASVGKNQNYYLPRFMAMEKTNKPVFNAMAFLVPFAWSLYRKMYKWALVVFALYIGLIFIMSYPMISNEQYNKAFYEVMNENPENPAESIYNITMYQYSNESIQLTEKQAEFIKASENITVSNWYIVVLYLYSFGMHTAFGLIANRFYFKKIKASVKLAEKSSIFQSMSDKEKIMYFLSKKATLPFALAAVIGVFEFMLIQL